MDAIIHINVVSFEAPPKNVQAWAAHASRPLNLRVALLTQQKLYTRVKHDRGKAGNLLRKMQANRKTHAQFDHAADNPALLDEVVDGSKPAKCSKTTSNAHMWVFGK